MPEYLTPGVYVEETTFRSRSIEGVATATFGMAGLTRYGPVPYLVTPPGAAEVVMTPDPLLVTSFTEFERAFGGLGEVGNTGLDDRTNYLAYAARAFFANGGRRLYVARVFPFTLDGGGQIDLGADVRVAGLRQPRGRHLARPLARRGQRRDRGLGVLPAQQEHPGRRR